MEIPTGSFERLIERLESYIRTSVELAKLKLVAALSLAAANFIAAVSTIIPLALFVLLFNLALAFWLGELLGKVYYGFFALAGFYLLLAIILNFALKNYVRKSISNYLIRKFMK